MKQIYSDNLFIKYLSGICLNYSSNILLNNLFDNLNYLKLNQKRIICKMYIKEITKLINYKYNNKINKIYTNIGILSIV